MGGVREKVRSFLGSNLLTLLTMIGVVVGVTVGLGLRASRDRPWSQRDAGYVSFVGQLFLRMLKALIIPLIVSSLISAVGNLDLSLSRRIGARAIAYYMSTTVLAVVLGMILVSSIRPGRGNDHGIERGERFSGNVTTADTLMDLVRNMFPPNLVEAAISKYRTKLQYPDDDTVQEYRKTVGNNSAEVPLDLYNMSGENVGGTNIMGLVVFSIVFGVVLSKMGSEASTLLLFFNQLSNATMQLTSYVIWLSPVGVAFLIAGKVLTMKSFSALLGQLGMYFITVMCGLFLHGMLVLNLLYFIVVRRLPFQFVWNLSQPLATAFGTASSSATLPVTIDALEKKNGVDPRISRFVLPIGATINMDGTALYEAVAAIFISQVRGISLSISNLVAISITATAASIGAAGIPQAGLVTMVMVLDTVGLPSDDVSLIIAVDWLLDRFRTATNVLGDSLGAGIVDHLSRAELKQLDERVHRSTSEHAHTLAVADTKCENTEM